MRILTTLCLLLAMTTPCFSSGEATVTLPLADYRALVTSVEKSIEARLEAARNAEPKVHEIIGQSAQMTIDEDHVDVVSTFRVEVRGPQLQTVVLPITGVPWSSTVEPSDHASLNRSDHGMELAVAQPGTFTVTVQSVALIDESDGIGGLTLAPAPSAVAVTDIDLPADLEWSCPGAVIAGEHSVDGRRSIRLAVKRNQKHTLKMWRGSSSGSAEELLARAVVVTVLSVGADGVTRHDVVLYEVSRGALAHLDVEIPDDLDVVQLDSDEGEYPILGGESLLSVQRQTLLKGNGHLVVTSRLQSDQEFNLPPLKPSVPVRARYLAVAASVAAEVTPLPDPNWARVDINDLPREVDDTVKALDLAAVWRVQGEDGVSRVAITTPPAANMAPTVIRRRVTTSLLTGEGTLLHRDRFSVTTSASGLEVLIPDDTTVWSSQVDGLAVRPITRGNKLVIPLPFGANRTSQVEFVVVQQHSTPPGKSSLSVGLPEVDAPVLLHSWQLLLPEDNRYRFADGDLKPTPFGSAGFWINDESVSHGRASSQGNMPSTGGATVRGQVLDDQGLPLPGVTVTLASERSGLEPRIAISDGKGNYGFFLLPSGNFTLEANLPGFTPVKQDLRLQTGRAARITQYMSPESFASEIEVTAEVPMVDTSQVNSSTVFDTSPGRRSRSPRKERKAPTPSQEMQSQRMASQQLEELSQGLVGGVRPVPVVIPERGKSITLEGVLPPHRVQVQLEVKAKR